VQIGPFRRRELQIVLRALARRRAVALDTGGTPLAILDPERRRQEETDAAERRTS